MVKCNAIIIAAWRVSEASYPFRHINPEVKEE
jgi:hypothetical protein